MKAKAMELSEAKTLEEVESRLESEQRAMELVVAENEELRALLNEAKEDIRAYAVHEYPYADKYPSEAMKLERDLDLVVRIEAAITPMPERE